MVANQVYRWDVVLKEMLELIEDGTYGGQYYELTLANGGLEMEMNPDYDLPDFVESAADDAIKGIIDGSIMIFP